MRKIEPELITGMGYIGDNPGVLYRMGGAGEQTVVTGNPALLEGVKGSRFTSLTLHGKSTQVRTTGAQLISLNDSYGVTTVNGVTKTPIGISTWKLEGISKEDTIFYPYSSLTFLSLSKGDYVFSVFGTSKAKARYTIIGGGSSGYIQAGYSQKISIQEDTKLTFNFMIQNGVESNGILMIMLNSGSTSLPWEPYTGGVPSPSPSYPQEIESAGQSGEISVKVGRTEMDKNPQVVIIPTPGGLPGIPVSSGGNYTDEKGQQWVADEIDLARGERVQWVYHRHYASDELLYRDNMNFNIYTYKSEDVNIIDDTKRILVNVGRYNPAFAQNNNYRGVTGGLRGRVDDIKSENDIKNVFPNGIDVWFIRKTPIRTPLPPETIAAYKALRTYSPTTTVINDAGAGMSVGYKRRK